MNLSIAEEITRLPKQQTSGCLSIFGCYLGRPLDTYEEFNDAWMEGDVLVLRYDRNIRIEIWDPSQLELDGSYMTIRHASRVRLS